MTKTEAAETLVTFITVRARHYGVSKVTKDFIETMIAEALTSGIEGSLIRRAAAVAPHWTAIRSAGRRT